MERVELRYRVLQEALKTLAEPLELLPEITDEKIYKMIRDSQIQRFEYSYEAFWQFLKSVLETNYSTEITSPSQIFRTCFKFKLITKIETDILLKMARDRNQTSHAYHESAAQMISEDIFKYHKSMKIIGSRIFKEDRTIAL